MQPIAELLLGPFLPEAFSILLGGIFVAALGTLLFFREGAARVYRKLAYGTAGIRIAYALIGSVGQYYIWSQGPFTQLFLPPYQPITYALFYVWARLWLAVALSIGLAIAFYFFLRSLQRYNERFFEEGDLELGAFAALIAGWPGFVVFLPAVFLAVIALSLIRGVFLGQPYTTLTAPFFAGAAIALLWGDALVTLFHLEALRI